MESVLPPRLGGDPADNRRERHQRQQPARGESPLSGDLKHCKRPAGEGNKDQCGAFTIQCSAKPHWE